uniref:Putative secreted protein n=1 Tax=Amblyomma triste TaxID=251400 RepID=A0A023G5Y5_AMBTT
MFIKGSIGFRTAAFTAAVMLSFCAVSAFQDEEGGTTELTECTQQEIARCYTQYVRNFYSYSPPYGSDITLSEDTYNEVCRGFNETSSCYAGFDRCPDSMKANFTRREEGYRALRALACDREAYQDALKVRYCVDPRKMGECIVEEHGEYELDRNFEKFFCAYSPTQKACYDRAWNASCTLPLEARRTAVTRIMTTGELIHDCERMYQRAPKPRSTNASASDPEAPGNCTAEISELKTLQRKALQTLYSLLEKVEAMEEAYKKEHIENAKIAHQQTKSIEALELVVQGLQRDIAQRRLSESQTPSERSRRGLF